MSGKDDNESKNFEPYENEKFTLVEQEIERNHKDLIGKDSDIKSRAKNDLSSHTPQAGLFQVSYYPF